MQLTCLCALKSPGAFENEAQSQLHPLSLYTMSTSDAMPVVATATEAQGQRLDSPSAVGPGLQIPPAVADFPAANITQRARIGMALAVQQSY